MPDKAKKTYRVDVHFTAVEIEDGNETVINDVPASWPNLPYEGLVAMQWAIVKFLEATVGFGFASAEKKGVLEALEALTGKKSK